MGVLLGITNKYAEHLVLLTTYSLYTAGVSAPLSYKAQKVLTKTPQRGMLLNIIVSADYSEAESEQ